MLNKYNVDSRQVEQMNKTFDQDLGLRKDKTNVRLRR